MADFRKSDSHQCHDDKHCIPQEMMINNVRLAAAYVPFQKLCSLFVPMEALKRGTAFPELFSPYKARDKKYRVDMEE